MPYYSHYISATHMFAAPHIPPYYALYSENLRPLSNYVTVPKDLSAMVLSNGDIGLQCDGGHEVSFDIIAMTLDECLDAPHGFSKYGGTRT